MVFKKQGFLNNDAPAHESDSNKATPNINNIMARNTSFLSADVINLNNKLKLVANPANDHIKIFGEINIHENFEYKIIDFVRRK